jgi:hypothetical protein
MSAEIWVLAASGLFWAVVVAVCWKIGREP